MRWSCGLLDLKKRGFAAAHRQRRRETSSPDRADGTRWSSSTHIMGIHIFMGDLVDAKLANVKRLTGENKARCRATTTALSIMRSAGMEP